MSKIKFIILACFIIAVAVTGVNISQNHNSMDVLIADISILAQASECCNATQTDEHCGMKKNWDEDGACCETSDSECDMCILSNYRKCKSS